MHDVKSISEKLEAAGVNPTAHRIAIYLYVLSEADHPTADDVKRWADENFPKLSLATVYNTLKTLVGAKLLKELKLPHIGKVLYDCNVSDHHHSEKAHGQLSRAFSGIRRPSAQLHPFPSGEDEEPWSGWSRRGGRLERGPCDAPSSRWKERGGVHSA